MTLANGTTLGPYQIVAPLGAGGMGEVYRARDTRLDRSVAIKILPDGLASSPDVRARFEREAKAISGLTHAHICALYDIGHQSGVDYLVMEYLEGETLADRIARGPLPVSQVLRHGAEIAQALHHAHRRGITHRDLKPGNVMLTASGAKLLDFGLAKLTVAERVVSHDALTEANLRPLTTEGTIVGTLPYMSPEQIEGKELDARSDIFSLGVMLYEMATGRRPFEGSSTAALAAAILSSDPPSQTAIPAPLDRVIRTALEKDPDQRWQTAYDLARQLRWLGEPSSGSQTTVRPVSRPRLPVIAAFVLTAIVTGLLVWGLASKLAPPVATALRLSVALPAGHEPFRHSETVSFAISPEGRRIAFVAFHEGKRSLFIRSLDAVTVYEVEGTDGAMAPFWSSDGTWIGYSTRNKLWKTRPSGGTPQAICDLPAGGVASWQGDTILFADLPGGRRNVYRVPAAGGTPVEVTKLNAAEGEMRHTFPRLLSDGKHFLYVASSNEAAERRLFLAALDSPLRKRIATNVSAARVVGDRLLYVRDGKLLAQRFDPGTGLSGDAQTVVEDVAFFFMTGRAEFDVSLNGVLAYATETSSNRLTVFDRKGSPARVLEEDASIYLLDVAPDGKRAAVSVRTRATGLMDIWIYDLTRGVRDRFTSDPGVESTPVWSTDGRTIIYGQASGGPPQLMRRAITAAAGTRVIAPGAFQTPGSFSADGKSLYYVSREGRSIDIMRCRLDGSNQSEVAVDLPSSWKGEPQASADGEWLAFVADPSGSYEIYVQNLLSGERVRISKGGGGFPRWRSDSRELFYVSPDNVVMSVIPSGGRWDDAVVTELFRAKNDIEAFDALPDGQSFLIAEEIPSTADSLIHLAMGW